MDGNCDNHSGVVCCFCNKAIWVSDIDPCDINIMINSMHSVPKKDQEDQSFWCHMACFEKKYINKV